MPIPIRLMEDAKLFVIVFSPGVKDLLTEVHDLFFVFARDTDCVRKRVHFCDFRAGFAGENDFFVFGSE